MDVAEALADTATGIYDGAVEAPGEVHDLTRRHVFDACLCLAAGLRFAGKGARDAAGALAGDTAVAGAVLDDAFLVRALDANDTYVPSPGGSFGHFSEVVPLAVELASRADERRRLDLLRGTLAAYQVMGDLLDHNRLERLGFHPASVVGVGASVLVGLAAGLSSTRLASALRLSWTLGSLPNTWLGAGHDSIGEFKTAAPGWSAMAGVRAVRATVAGMSMPTGGLEVSGLSVPAARSVGRWQVQQIAHKLDAAQIHLQVVARLGRTLRARGVDVSDIRRARLHGHARMTGGVQGSRAAFDPASASDADHSCPFVFMAAVACGDVTPSLYANGLWRDGPVRDAMSRVELHVSADADALFENERRWHATAEVETATESRIQVQADDFVGSPHCPATWDDLEAKGHRFLELRTDSPVAADVGRLRAACEALSPDPAGGRAGELVTALRDLRVAADGSPRPTPRAETVTNGAGG